MKTYDFEAAGRQAVQQIEQAVQQAPAMVRDLQSVGPFDWESKARQARHVVDELHAKVVQNSPPIVRQFTGDFSPFDSLMCLGCVALILLALGPRIFGRRSKRGRRDPVLDKVIFRWDRANSLVARDLVANIHVAGGTGSGKSSSFRQVARSILAFGNTSVLVLCAKRGEYLDWLKLAKETGRRRDVILIDPEHGNYLNLIGHVARQNNDRAGVAREVTGFLMTAREVLLRQSNQTGGESQIWKQQDERAIKSAVTLLALAGEEINATNISRLILSAPQSDAEMKTDAWKHDYCSQCLQKAYAAAKDEMSRHDFEQAGTYMTREWCGLGEKTRASVLMGTMATLSMLNSGLVWKMFGNTTTFSLIDAIEGRKIVIVNVPPDVHGDLGRIANCGIKHLWQKEILRRKVTRKSPISAVWADESSQFITSFDASYLSRCRSSLGSMVYLTQSLASYRDVLPGDQADASIKALLGNFTTKVFFALGDHDTAEWAAKLVGQELRATHGGSTSNGDFEPFAMFPDQSKVTSSFNESWEHLVRPEQFMSGLRTGSPANNYQVDALIVRFGGLFSNGLPVIQATFDQRK